MVSLYPKYQALNLVPIIRLCQLSVFSSVRIIWLKCWNDCYIVSHWRSHAHHYYWYPTVPSVTVNTTFSSQNEEKYTLMTCEQWLELLLLFDTVAPSHKIHDPRLDTALGEPSGKTALYTAAVNYCSVVALLFCYSNLPPSTNNITVQLTLWPNGEMDEHVQMRADAYNLRRYKGAPKRGSWSVSSLGQSEQHLLNESPPSWTLPISNRHATLHNCSS
jgi:hypothetical protein